MVRRRQALLTPLVLTSLASMLQASNPAFADEEAVMEMEKAVVRETIEERDLAAEVPSTSTRAGPTVYSSSKVHEGPAG